MFRSTDLWKECQRWFDAWWDAQSNLRKRSKRNFVPKEIYHRPRNKYYHRPQITLKKAVSIDIMTSLGNEQSCESDNPSLLDEHSQKSHSWAVWLFFICWIVPWKGYSIQFLLIFRKGKNLEAKTNAICSMVSNKTPSAFQQDFVTAIYFCHVFKMYVIMWRLNLRRIQFVPFGLFRIASQEPRGFNRRSTVAVVSLHPW